MDNLHRHKIGQQTIDLDLHESRKAGEIRTEISHYLTAELLPEMESLFDTIAGDDRTLRIEKIVLDLGDIVDSEWKKSLTDKVLQNLRHTIASTVGSKAEPKTEPEFLNTQRLNPLDDAIKKLLYFLANGRLPERVDKAGRDIFQIRYTDLTEHHWRKLFELVQNDHTARLRLITHCSDGFVSYMLNKLSGLSNTEIILQQMTPALSEQKILRLWRHYFWYAALESVNVGPQTNAQSRLLARKLYWVRKAVLRLNKVVSLDDRKQTSSADRVQTGLPSILPEPWKSWFTEAASDSHFTVLSELNSVTLLKKLLSGYPWQELLLPDKHQTAKILRQPEQFNDSNRLAKPRLRSVDSSLHDTLSGNKTFIETRGSGLVILHPFLEELFETQDLLYQRRFKNDDSREQAVRLLTYLVFGEAQVPEYDLVLIKLVCDLPWRDTLLFEKLSASQRQACDELLLAVLKHWQALKSHSAEWLRTQFLLRNGQLSEVDNGWKLAIENHAQDVLLNKLPWGVGVIRLPWMTELLFVEWTN